MNLSVTHAWHGQLFGDPEAEALWSADAQLAHFLAFEAGLARALGKAGLVAPELSNRAAKIIAQSEIDTEALAVATARDGVPIPALVRQLRAAAPGCETAIHTGATSQDVMDTALSLTLLSTARLLLERLDGLLARLEALGNLHGQQPLMARTRMQAALPITIADRIAAWSAPLITARSGLAEARDAIARLQLGGAVGTRHAYGDKGAVVAKHLAKTLGLVDDGVWHSDRSKIAEFAGRLSTISGALGKIGQDITLMAQQGIDAVTLSGGGGSSAMPHKSNPVMGELLVTLARYNATQISAMHHSILHEQERSGAAWMLEWMVLPQMAVCTARALQVAEDLCEQIIGMGEAQTR